MDSSLRSKQGLSSSSAISSLETNAPKLVPVCLKNPSVSQRPHTGVNANDRQSPFWLIGIALIDYAT